MMNTKVWWAFLPLVQFVVAYPQNTLKMGRSVSCRADTEYPHSNICCLKCAAGQYVQTPCTETGKKGVCGECDYGTFTEHANGLKQCIKCTQCPPDQEIVRVCTHTQDTMCQCKPGRYCHPDEACEICKTCSRCKSDEEVVKNCTSTSNTECKKLQPKSKPGADAALTVGVAVPIVVLFVGFIIFIICWKKKYRTADSDNVKPDYVSVNEQCSTNPTLRNSLEEDLFPNLVPLNGVESLKECFGFFEELNMDFHKRFFRQLSLSDNMIRSKDNLPYEDRIHDLLTHWVEKEGEDASLEHLLRALLDLNQRRTAETIMQKAVQCGHYKQESLSLEDDD
ncbi:hematopoietic death receptor isoform 4-T4 [Anableps anableps]